MVPASGRVFSFGLGAYGQLGHSDTDSKNSPCHVKGQWMENGTGSQYVVTRIAAGGDSSMIHLSIKVIINVFGENPQRWDNKPNRLRKT